MEKLSCQLRWGRVQSYAIIYISAVGQAVRAPREGEVELYTDEESLLSPVSGGPGPSTSGEVHGKIQVYISTCAIISCAQVVMDSGAKQLPGKTWEQLWGGRRRRMST